MSACLTSKAVLLLAAACLAVVPPSWAGQAAAPPVRVRVTTADGRYVGRLGELRSDTLVLERSHGNRTERIPVARREIRKLEISQRPSRRGKGAKIGSFVGVGAAVAIGIWGGESCPSDPGPATWGNFTQRLNYSLCIDHVEAGFFSALVMIPLGALLGYALAPGEKWRSARPGELTVSPMVTSGGGAGLRLTLSF